MLRKFLVFILFFAFFIVLIPEVQSAQAASLLFDPTSSTVSVNGTFTVNVNIDAGSDSVAGVEAYILYDANLLEPQNVAAGNYFPIVTNNITTGRINITGVVENSSQYKTGSGTVATITFRGLRAGTGILRYDCDLTRNDSSKIVKNDLNATNLISCSTLGTHSYTISSVAGGVATGTTNTAGATAGTTATTTTTSTQLPQSGIYENVQKITMPALIFVGAGLFLKLALILLKGS